MCYDWDIGRETVRQPTNQPTMTTTIQGRSFQITENTNELANLRKHLISRGFDGTIWEGFSARVGRQRKDLHSMIYRKPSGEFVIAVSL
jgi:hypothetical protein